MPPVFRFPSLSAPSAARALTMVKGVIAAVVLGVGVAWSVTASAQDSASFHSLEATSLEGAPLPMEAFAGKAVLVVNTASLCGFTPQYSGLQALHEHYAPQGLVVLGVPSNSFRQELESSEDVAEFCEVQFGLTFPMTDIAPVTGRSAHPVFAWLADQGARPRWNFHKFLIGPDGAFIRDWPSHIAPDNAALRRVIEANLPSG